VEYCGLYDRRSICGDWTLTGFTGGFWIWPDALAQSEEEAVQEELELVTRSRKTAFSVMATAQKEFSTPSR